VSRITIIYTLSVSLDLLKTVKCHYISWTIFSFDCIPKYYGY